jgi:1-acyl-sn-glycerol-3-phosphate acyltransferase
MWVATAMFDHGRPGLPVPLQFAIVGYGVALASMLFANIPPLAPKRINDGLIGPFLRSALAIGRDRLAFLSLLSLWLLFGIGMAILLWLIPRDQSEHFLIYLILGVIAGALPSHVFRPLAFVPPAATVLVFTTIYTLTSSQWVTVAPIMAVAIGVMLPPLLTTLTIHQPESTRGHGFAGFSLVIFAFLAHLLFWLPDPEQSRKMLGLGILIISSVLCVAAWMLLARPFVEQLSEFVMAPMYRFQVVGTGAGRLPWKGPVLVIANHAALVDPLMIAKILPTPIIPMMTSKYFDHPLLKFLMRDIFRCIRVPDVTVRKDAPELDDAVAALDRGDCLVIFPEGWLRRKPEQELRRFGRGIWRILQERPDTPIVACWIDGNWGSMFSYQGGPPMKNKKWDIWRTIRIGVHEPFRIDPEVLKNHLATRFALMNKVLEARSELGLPPIEPPALPREEEDDPENKEEA